MSLQRLWVPGPLPGLNEIIEAKALGAVRRARGQHGWRAGTYSEMKKTWNELVVNCCEAAGLTPVTKAFMTYLVFEPNRRRDPSNVISGAVKIIEDGLQEAGVLPNDGWANIMDIREHWDLDADAPGCAVFISTVRVLERLEAKERANG